MYNVISIINDSSSSSVYDVVIIMMISSAVYNAIMMMMMMMNIIILVLWLSCNVEQLGLLFKWAMSINSTLYLLDINQPPISLGRRTPLLQTAHFTFCLNRRSAPRPPKCFSHDTQLNSSMNSSTSTSRCPEVKKISDIFDRGGGLVFKKFFFLRAVNI